LFQRPLKVSIPALQIIIIETSVTTALSISVAYTLLTTISYARDGTFFAVMIDIGKFCDALWHVTWQSQLIFCRGFVVGYWNLVVEIIIVQLFFDA
jgi:hypothetical protein